MAWTTLNDSDLAAGVPAKQSTLRGLRDNNRANANKPIAIDIDETKTVSTTYAFMDGGQSDYYIFVPEDADNLLLRLKVWTASSTATFKATIDKASSPSGTLDSDEVATTQTSEPTDGSAATNNTTSGSITLTLAGLDNVGGDDLRGQEARVRIQAKVASGSVSVNCEAWTVDYGGPSSYFNRTDG